MPHDDDASTAPGKTRTVLVTTNTRARLDATATVSMLGADQSGQFVIDVTGSNVSSPPIDPFAALGLGMLGFTMPSSLRSPQPPASADDDPVRAKRRRLARLARAARKATRRHA